MSADIQYPDVLIERLHTIWGEGYLAPGGPEEVAKIVDGLDLEGQTVLDIGFGTGGPTIELVRTHKAGKVVGVDVEAPMLDKAMKIVERAGVADKIDLQVVEPGPLPFGEGTFDVVFSSGAIIHIEDKTAFFHDILRVLKPGGVLVANDWLSGEGDEAKRGLDGFLKLAHLEFTMATAPEMAALLSKAGFETVSMRDRNQWFVENVAGEIEAIEGPLHKSMLETFGEERVSKWITMTHARAEAARSGGLRPTHFRGFKPKAT